MHDQLFCLIHNLCIIKETGVMPVFLFDNIGEVLVRNGQFPGNLVQLQELDSVAINDILYMMI
jgi:hypothetical protein